MVYRVYVEKKSGLTHEADSLKNEIVNLLQITRLENLRLLNRYDAENIEKAVFLIYENTYGRMGTIVKSWIKNKTTICLENLEINSKYGSREFWFMCAYLPKGQRNTFEVEGQVDLHLDNLPWNFREEHAWAVVREKWAYLCFVIEGFYQAEPDTSFAIDLVNFPTDIVSEVPYVAQTTNKSGFGSHVMSCTVSEGKFNNPGCTEAFLKDASSSFVKVFIVR